MKEQYNAAFIITQFSGDLSIQLTTERLMVSDKFA